MHVVVSDPRKKALILIDAQRGFHDPYWGSRNNPGAEAAIRRALDIARSKGLVVIHVRHASVFAQSPLQRDKEGFAFLAEAQPKDDEKVITKSVHSAFIGTDLAASLDAAGIKQLVFAGITTDHCVSTSVRMAFDLGYTATVLVDAVFTFDRHDYDGRLIAAEAVHRAALASLNGEFATLCKVDDEQWWLAG